MAKKKTQSYECPKCSNKSFKSDEIRVTGSGFSRFFDVQNRKYIAISCENCGYTEFYNKKTSGISSMLDFLIGS
jgi:uncharacterized protein